MAEEKSQSWLWPIILVMAWWILMAFVVNQTQASNIRELKDRTTTLEQEVQRLKLSQNKE